MALAKHIKFKLIFNISEMGSSPPWSDSGGDPSPPWQDSGDDPLHTPAESMAARPYQVMIGGTGIMSGDPTHQSIVKYNSNPNRLSCWRKQKERISLCISAPALEKPSSPQCS